MKQQTFFKRYEMKYILTRNEYERILCLMSKYMCDDEYAISNICNIYYDTDNYRLIRRSIEKPIYKEKIRLRSYGVPRSDTHVFLEIKKKFESVVYKRRIDILEKDAIDYMNNISPIPDSQIGREIDYFKNFYGPLKPMMYVGYKRHSYKGIDIPSLRITFDTDIVWRDYDLMLEKGMYGYQLLEEGQVLMEIKAQSAIPLWLTEFLTNYRIYRTSFSKYGTAYKQLMKESRGRKYA